MTRAFNMSSKFTFICFNKVDAVAIMVLAQWCRNKTDESSQQQCSMVISVLPFSCNSHKGEKKTSRTEEKVYFNNWSLNVCIKLCK